jgi:predicted DNA-binding transcriptional regulator YafY
VRRADRLFRIVQRLRRRGVTTARSLAEDLGVSERTVYRDVRDLVLSGVPVLGEAGVGYALPRGYDLPPLMFNEDEIEALVLGARVVHSWADPQLRAAAGDVLAKVEAVLPPALRDRLTASALLSPGIRVSRAVAEELSTLRAALREKRKIHFRYVDKSGAATSRTIWPLALAFWGKSWSVAGYCELRQDFRNFTAERVTGLTVLEEKFGDVPGRTLRDLIDYYEKEERRRKSSSGQNRS